MAALLNNKVTLVTGAGGGIGRATAIVLVREGAKVLVSDISTRRGEETVAIVRQAGGKASPPHYACAVACVSSNAATIKARIRWALIGSVCAGGCRLGFRWATQSRYRLICLALPI